MEEHFEAKMGRGGAQAVEEACRFFMRNDPVHQAMRKLAGRLEGLGIPYAVAGGMALVANGYDRTTVDVDVLVTPEGLRTIHERLSGLGYVEPFSGSKQLRDTEHGVRIEFLVSGQYPGDGKPKPVAFPDPAQVSMEREGIRYLKLHALLELKLASGMTSPGRLKDLADVQELIRLLGLKEDVGATLNSYVGEKYRELWASVQGAAES